MGNDNPSLGKASLWSAIIGVGLPGSLAVLVVIFLKTKEEQAVGYAISGLLFGILEMVALGCGIAARRTATGKAGLVISGMILLLVLFLAAFSIRAWLEM